MSLLKTTGMIASAALLVFFWSYSFGWHLLPTGKDDLIAQGIFFGALGGSFITFLAVSVKCGLQASFVGYCIAWTVACVVLFAYYGFPLSQNIWSMLFTAFLFGGMPLGNLFMLAWSAFFDWTERVAERHV